MKRLSPLAFRMASLDRGSGNENEFVSAAVSSKTKRIYLRNPALGGSITARISSLLA